MIATQLYLGHPLASVRASLHNGPGWRLSFWFQGCSLRCTRRCLNPGLLAPPRGAAVAIEDVAAVLDARTAPHPVEGITVLGGEPSDQPQGLAALLVEARARGLSTMVYTGHVLESLPPVPGADEWLPHVDLLVDGPFVEEAYDETLAWRGSRNQRLHCLSSRYDDALLALSYARQKKGWSLRVGADGLISVSGLQERAAAARIERLLRH